MLKRLGEFWETYKDPAGFLAQVLAALLFVILYFLPPLPPLAPVLALILAWLVAGLYHWLRRYRWKDLLRRTLLPATALGAITVLAYSMLRAPSVPTLVYGRSRIDRDAVLLHFDVHDGHNYRIRLRSGYWDDQEQAMARDDGHGGQACCVVELPLKTRIPATGADLATTEIQIVRHRRLWETEDHVVDRVSLDFIRGEISRSRPPTVAAGKLP